MKFVPELQSPLTLLAIDRPSERELRVVVRVAAGYKPPEPPLGRSGWDVLSYPNIYIPSACYEIYFPSYIMYCVTDESYHAPDNQAESEGAQFSRYSKSKFLEVSETLCYGQDIHPGQRFHYGIYCLDTCIDLISSESPSIAYLGETAR
jgi:hypothetical protein